MKRISIESYLEKNLEIKVANLQELFLCKHVPEQQCPHISRTFILSSYYSYYWLVALRRLMSNMI